jgi:hypothetical protein
MIAQRIEIVPVVFCQTRRLEVNGSFPERCRLDESLICFTCGFHRPATSIDCATPQDLGHGNEVARVPRERVDSAAVFREPSLAACLDGPN